jgi:hypothetical protein
MNATLTENNLMPEILAASGRSPEIPEAMDLYGFLIGSWELAVVARDDNGNVTHSTGEAHVGWILEGRAVQDVFINPRRSDRTRSLPNSPTGLARRCASTIQGFRLGGSIGSILTMAFALS